MYRLRVLILKSSLGPLASAVHARLRDTPASAFARHAYGLIWETAYRCKVTRGLPPHSYKERLVRRYGKRYGLNCLVETGTLHGDMLQAAKGWFSSLYSIELDDTLYEAARVRFASQGNILLLHGDSGVLLPQVLHELAEPALFWLDAHYSGHGTAGEEQNPIAREVQAILCDKKDGHVVLIDDARAFCGRNGYPTLNELGITLRESRPNIRMTVDADVIRIGP
jgi:hypothetical protein